MTDEEQTEQLDGFYKLTKYKSPDDAPWDKAKKNIEKMKLAAKKQFAEAGYPAINHKLTKPKPGYVNVNLFYYDEPEDIVIEMMYFFNEIGWFTWSTSLYPDDVDPDTNKVFEVQMDGLVEAFIKVIAHKGAQKVLPKEKK